MCLIRSGCLVFDVIVLMLCIMNLSSSDQLLIYYCEGQSLRLVTNDMISEILTMSYYYAVNCKAVRIFSRSRSK